MRPAGFLRQDPGANLPGRIVTNMLIVAALEFGHPMCLRILVKSYDASLHA